MRREFFHGRNTSFGNNEQMKEVQAIVAGWFHVRWRNFLPRRNHLILFMCLSSLASSSTDLPLWPLAGEVAVVRFTVIIVSGSGCVSVFSGHLHWMWPCLPHRKHQPSCCCCSFGSSSGGSVVQIVGGGMIDLGQNRCASVVSSSSGAIAVIMAWCLWVETFHVSHVSGPSWFMQLSSSLKGSPHLNNSRTAGSFSWYRTLHANLANWVMYESMSPFFMWRVSRSAVAW